MAFVLVLGVGVPSAYAVHDLGLFELDTRAGVDGDQDKKNDPIPALVGDGNTTDDGKVGALGGDDWDKVYLGTSSAFAVSFIEDTFANNPIVNGAEAFVAARTPEISFFTGGGSKDTNGIQDGPWQYKVVSDQVPDKNDIVNAFAAAYNDPVSGDTILYFGLDTLSVNGAANAGFWFFRDEVGLAPLAEGADIGDFVGEHQDGDVFVSVGYQEGGKVGLIEVYKWVGDDATGSLELQQNLSGISCASTGGNDDVCGVINKLLPDQTFGEDPIFDYANTLVANNPLEPTSYQYQSAAFVEFGLNLNTVLGDDIGCFSTFLAETRSSDSDTAQLKDFAFGEFNLCGLAVTKDCDASINAAGTAANVEFYGTTTNTGGVEIITTLTDDVGGNDDVTATTFTAVCIDDDGTEGCGAGDTMLTGVSGIGTNSLSFDHPAGAVVRYEGNYSTSILVDSGGEPGFDFSDTVTASGLFNSDPIDGGSDTAMCSAVGMADIAVTKSCTNARVTGGDTFEADISGTVENTGNVRLDNVMWTDTTNSGEPATGYVVLRDDGVTPFVEGESLAPGEVLTFTASVSSTTQLTHMNTIEFSGENTFDSSDTASDAAVAPNTGEGEVCEVTVLPAINIAKDCAPDAIDLGFKEGILTIFVNTEITLDTNGSEENLVSVEVTDPEGGLAYASGTPTFTCNAEGTSCTADGVFAKDSSVSFTQTYNPDTVGTDILNGLDDPDLVSFYNKATVSGAGILSAAPVADMDDTECDLCQ